MRSESVCLLSLVCVFLDFVMMDEVLGKWRFLAITEEEGEAIGISDELLEKGKSLIPCGLVGKILTKKPYNKKALMDTMAYGAVDVQQIIDSSYKTFEGFNLGDVGDFQFTQMWVNVYNLPPDRMIREIGMKTGDVTRVAIWVINNEEGRCIGPYIRLRAMCQVAKVSLGSSGRSVWVDLKYERVPDYCFVCGIIGHGSLRKNSGQIRSRQVEMVSRKKGVDSRPIVTRESREPANSNLNEADLEFINRGPNVGVSTFTPGLTHTAELESAHAPLPKINELRDSSSVEEVLLGKKKKKNS
ncbi:hypothetical protein TIFTF001_016394 [Ficus carica]|uniref:Zinc knuckle CX2CX4HX4C domain-containing protein n=1 Tax=Ficus carica TaxID=3494 RepID=A0AA88ANI9_FICCA|nr:hypothetical protein TIFTF001_016394 [Ficus carica]